MQIDTASAVRDDSIDDTPSPARCQSSACLDLADHGDQTEPVDAESGLCARCLAAEIEHAGLTIVSNDYRGWAQECLHECALEYVRRHLESHAA